MLRIKKSKKMKKVLATIGLFLAGVIGAVILLFSAAIEMIEFVLSLIGWATVFAIGWLVYQLKVSD